LIIPVLAVGASLWAQDTGFGLMNADASPLASWPYWLKVVATIIVLDLAIYTQHAAFHHVPVLWRLHRTHHADDELDVTTGFRFHPIEIWFSMAIKMAVVVALGAPVVAVVLFEVLLSALALFNHANVAIPGPVDRVLRWFIVSPAMHRVHHSPVRDETDSNFGFNLSIWDRLFRTYRHAMRDPDAAFAIGLESHRDARMRSFRALIVDPFRSLDRSPDPRKPRKEAA
ncbi:MAG: sterol desaturase family protein, partial [Sphingomonadales bacterium]